MNENEIRTRLNDATGEADYPPALKRQIESRIAEPEVSGHTRLLSMIAAVLALLTVVSLVYVRFQSTRPTIPAATPGPSTRIPAPVLRAAQIEAASGLISEPNLAGTVGDRTVTLEGVYADELNMALIFRVSPATTTP